MGWSSQWWDGCDRCTRDDMLERGHGRRLPYPARPDAAVRYGSGCQPLDQPVSRFDQGGPVELRVVHVGSDRMTHHSTLRIRLQEFVRLFDPGGEPGIVVF